ncbi:uncharacterized protein LOC124894378 [Capsicum annuum]|uniref:uncharacterized protein LOC124894378 n=1 Tax=Capsicum annuum TaxID=4072 RepID=UPI001FB183C6|nr:uncharacterized protein LOC124894378 [Capsicum annuum]
MPPVTLIPKKTEAVELKDFRPISLIGGVYKIIAKILAEGLKTMINKLVNKHQMAFIKGRQIMVVALIASECVDTRIRWKIGFGERWLKWMGACVKTVRFFVLISGEPAGFFPSERGLKQGDTLSPFLFILVTEGFDSMMRVAIQNSLLKGFVIVEERLDKHRRDFLWLGNKGKGTHLVKWQIAQLSKSNGDLGIRNLRLQNNCLLTKWLWRFGNEEQALWREVIVSKYGQNEQWCSNPVNTTHGVSVWRTIRSLWSQLVKDITFKVGTGTRIMFWKELWIGQEPLMASYPDLFIFSTNPDAMVNEIW